jgi:site-specific DNA-methyltransferase (adenine-specific)
MNTNTLYYGDNLKILRKYVSDESVDLIYLDPPFNSKRAYNVIFKDQTGKDEPAQIQAFEDTWQWTQDTQETYDEIMGGKFPVELKNVMEAFKGFLDRNNLMAYLTMMAIRLVEMHRVLKDTGSIYLHCDPTASHYLKILMDQVFGVKNFRNEIVWRYRRWPSKQKNFQRMHDTVLRYSKTPNSKWNQLYDPLSEETRKRIKDGKKIVTFIDGFGKKKIRPTSENSLGVPMCDVWEIRQIVGPSEERIGYPTQKPLALIERIIEASSNQGDVVMDPFCGCGTAVVAAEKLGRQWIGIDVTHLAIALVKKRLHDHFPEVQFQVKGEPESVEAARELANQSKFQFEAWAVSLLGGQPYKSKGGGDTGIDGLLYFKDFKGMFHKIIIEVKGGGYQPKDIRALGNVLERENAPLGVIIALESPTKGMLSEAAGLGTWKMPGSRKEYPVLQLFTIQDFFNGRKPDLPDTSETLKKAKREIRESEKTKNFL